MTEKPQEAEARNDQAKLYFITDYRPAPGTAEAHGLWDGVMGVFRPVDDVKADAATVFEQAAQLATTALSNAPAGLQLEAVTFSLGFDAKGKLGFIAEAGVTASVEVSFKRA